MVLYQYINASIFLNAIWTMSEINLYDDDDDDD